MKWIEVCIESDVDISEKVSMVLLEAGAMGTQIQNPDEIKSLIDDAGAKELADYGDFSSILDKNKVTAYFATGTDLEVLRNSMNEFQDIPGFAFLWREVDDASWKGNWKKYYKTFRLTEKIKIIPSWEENADKDEYTIIMDPGMAFGTGTHETTSLCSELIEKKIKSGDSILDIGTGTGILSIVASKLGASFEMALDIDPAAVKTAAANFGMNQVSNAVVFKGELKDIRYFTLPDSLEEKPEISDGFDMIAANIVSDVLISIAEDMKEHLKKGGSLICSGIIQERENDVKKALIDAGFNNIILYHKNEWTAITADA